MKMSWELIDPGTNGWSTLHPYRNDHDPCTPQSPVVHLHSPLAAMCAAVGRAPTPFELPVARTSGPGDVLAQNWKLAPRGWKPMRWTKILFQGYFMIFWCFLFPAQKRVLEDKSRTPYVFHGQHSLIWKNIRILLQNQQLVEERLRKEKKNCRVEFNEEFPYAGSKIAIKHLQLLWQLIDFLRSAWLNYGDHGLSDSDCGWGWKLIFHHNVC